MGSKRTQGISQARLAAAQVMAIDRTSAEVISALHGAGIRSVLLKGPAIADALYDDGTVRMYDDCDLLLAPWDIAAAEPVLRDLRFELLGVSRISRDPDDHSLCWSRDGVTVDLHYTLFGAAVEPAEVWRVVTEHLGKLRVVGVEADVPRAELLAFHTAIHAAQHGRNVSRPLDDLSRAASRFPMSVWERGAQVAQRLGAVELFATGLRLVPEGQRVAVDLALPAARSAELALLVERDRQTAIGWARLLQTKGFFRKVRFLAREVVPPPAAMRYRYARARRGSVGLTLAYILRACELTVQAAPAFREARRARRGLGRQSQRTSK